MNVGTPVRYIDPDQNEWAGIIIGREFDAHFHKPVGKHVRNETGRFNCMLWGTDGHQIFRTINPGDLLEVDPFDSEPTFAQYEGAVRSEAVAAPAPAAGVSMADVNAAMDAKFTAMLAQLSARLAPPSPPRARRTVRLAPSSKARRARK